MLSIYAAVKDFRSRFELASGPVVLGREPGVDGARMVIADPYVSAEQLRLEELPGGRIRLKNLSRRVPVGLLGGAILAPGGSAEVDLPTRLRVGECWVDVIAAGPGDGSGDGLSALEPPAADGPGVPAAELDGSPPAAWLARWFERLLAIQRAAAGRGDFYREAARAVVDLAGLDSGSLLLRRGGDWQVVARAGQDGPGAGAPFSRTILDLACSDRRTFYRAAALGGAVRSLDGVEAVVVSPILGGDESTVVGAIYGVRLATPSGPSAEILPVEAQLVRILAEAVGAGKALLEAEAEATRRLVQFEQFFSTELARELERDPGMLDGRERTITALFSDIRGFSAISERLPPREVCDLISDVMDRLTVRVRGEGGVVVDYVGDGLLAMWNAPTDQPDHALRACRAARAMVGELPGLNARWQPWVGAPLRLGIGLNTGPALVGNTGSRARFKYGPLGHSVNLASRVEGATKQFGVPILLTGSTHDALGGALPTRRLCRVRVVGIAGAVDLHELPEGAIDDAWAKRSGAYEKGLARYEAGDLAGACRELYEFADAFGEGGPDLPTLSLVGRAIEHLKSPGLPFDPVIDLTSK